MLAGKTLFVRYHLDSGFNASTTYPGGVILAVKTGANYTYASTIYNNVGLPDASPTTWHEIDLNMTTPGFVDATNTIPYDPTSVVAIELHFDTGGGPTTAGADAGALPTTATFHIDTIGYF